MAELSAAQRKKIQKSRFAFPSKAPGAGSYPIHDKAHAANARARVRQHGSPAQQKAVFSKTAHFFKGAPKTRFAAGPSGGNGRSRPCHARRQRSAPA